MRLTRRQNGVPATLAEIGWFFINTDHQDSYATASPVSARARK
jgi:hypothetical protein